VAARGSIPNMKRLLPLFLLSVLGLASCSSGGPQSASGSPSATPVTRTITVEIVDSIPLSVYYNLDEVVPGLVEFEWRSPA